MLSKCILELSDQFIPVESFERYDLGFAAGHRKRDA